MRIFLQKPVKYCNSFSRFRKKNYFTHWFFSVYFFFLSYSDYSVLIETVSQIAIFFYIPRKYAFFFNMHWTARKKKSTKWRKVLAHFGLFWAKSRSYFIKHNNIAFGGGLFCLGEGVVKKNEKNYSNRNILKENI